LQLPNNILGYFQYGINRRGFEPSKRRTGPVVIEGGGRAEPTTEAMEGETVVAAQSTPSELMKWKGVDVPRFELGVFIFG